MIKSKTIYINVHVLMRVSMGFTDKRIMALEFKD